jgi:hypothetical protein
MDYIAMSRVFLASKNHAKPESVGKLADFKGNFSLDFH